MHGILFRAEFVDGVHVTLLIIQNGNHLDQVM